MKKQSETSRLNRKLGTPKDRMELRMARHNDRVKNLPVKPNRKNRPTALVLEGKDYGILTDANTNAVLNFSSKNKAKRFLEATAREPGSTLRPVGWRKLKKLYKMRTRNVYIDDRSRFMTAV